MTKIAVIYYSKTGNVQALAEAVAEGADDAGAEVRLRSVDDATNDDVRWADGLAFGSPTRFGNISAELKKFLEGTGPLWAAGELANKVATGFTSSSNLHGGQESTLLALYQTMYHWGAIVVAPGYTDPSVTEAGGNPYGTSHPSAGGPPGENVLAAARHQGRRLASIAELIAGYDSSAASMRSRSPALANR